MMKRIICLAAAASAAVSLYAAGMVSGLSTDLLNGDGVEVLSASPSFGWRLEGFGKNTLQKSYRILVATKPELLAEGKADVWDSGRVRGRRPIVRPSLGLSAGTDYYWTVKVWTNRFERSEYAPAVHFVTSAELDGTPSRYRLVKTEEEPVMSGHFGSDTLWVDFGRDAYSQISFTATCEEDGAEVLVHLGEAQSEGRLLRNVGGTSIRYKAIKVALHKGTDTYFVDIPKDGRNSTIVPGRSYNPVLMPEYIGEVFPFRYCEIEGDYSIRDVRRYVVNYPFDEDASYFECSDDTLNMVWDLCKYTVKATSALGVYIDGDRERIPYEADALINQLSHYGVDAEYSLARYSVDYLCRNATWPTEWILQALIMAWNDYMYTGDPYLLERNYDILKARTLIDLKCENGLISTQTGLQTPDLIRRIGYAGGSVRDIVDWPQGGAAGIAKEASGEADGFVMSAYNAVVNAFHYEALKLMGGIASVLDRKEDEVFFNDSAAAVLKAFNELLFDTGKGCYRDGVGIDHCSLHTNMLALDFGMVPKESLSEVLAFVKSRGMACSVYGAQFLLEALYGVGEGEYAYDLMTDTGLRGWFNMIRLGSTITLEAWDNVFKGNLDWNHAWGSAPANAIPRGLVGVRPLEPGFGLVEIKPQPGPLDSFTATVPTPRGPIDVTLDEKTVEIEIPAGIRAKIYVPKPDCGGFRIRRAGSGHHVYTR